MTLFGTNTLISITVAILVTSNVARASEDSSNKNANSGTFAVPVIRVEPTYPRGPLNRGQEGWVILSYVVQPDGTVADPIIDDSSGILAFEKSAMKAVTKWKFRPATWNGEPVEQCRTKVKMTFALDVKRRGAKRRFITFYKDTQELIKNGDVDGAELLIDKTMAQAKWNNYEYARIWLLKSLVAERRGDEQTQLSALYRTLGEESNYIEESLLKVLLPSILQLELVLGKYSAAIATYEKLKKYPELLNEKQQLVASVTTIIKRVQNERSLSVPGEIDKCSECPGRWSYAPLRREFAFDDINGELDEFELRCDWKRFRDDVNSESTWRIPGSWGKCQLYVYGEPGTTFKFIEYREKVETQSSNLLIPNDAHIDHTDHYDS